MAGLRGSLHITMLVALLLLGLLSAAPTGAEAQAVGVCYGMNGNDLPEPSAVVGLLQSKNIRKVRLFEPNQAALEALGNSGIEVNLGVPNSELPNIANDPSAAGSWVATNIQAYPSVTFGSIAVGNELIPGSELIPGTQAQFVLPAMQNIYNSIQAAGLGAQIKVSTVVSSSVTIGFPPSAGVFTPQAMPFMKPIVQFLARTGAPLMVTVYPYFAYLLKDNIGLDYALFTANDDVVIDGALRYRNLFDAMVDTVYSAIEKVDGLDSTSAANIGMGVQESGWPSKGGSGGSAADDKAYEATVSDASTYVQNLVNHVAQGTPKRPGTPVDTYVFALFNENLKEGPETERNFGLFYPDMRPVYDINFP